MSNPSTQLTDLRTWLPTSLPVHRGCQMLAAPARFVGFWAAVSMPFLYVPLLSDGLEAGEVTVFLGLLLLNLLAFVVGHGHKR